MAHSIELLFDEATERAIRREWDALAAAGLPSLANHRSPTNRPHVTLIAAPRIDPEVDEALRDTVGHLPLACRVGAPMIFGRRSLTLVRLIVPSAGLLALHADVHDIVVRHVPSEGRYPHTVPGSWTPHVTLARRFVAGHLSAALSATGADEEIDGNAVGMRRWDGDRKEDVQVR